jgi:integrase
MTTNFKLTERTVAELKPTDQDYKAFDTLLAGFHVRVFPSGIKSYALSYRNRDGKQRTLTLGRTSITKTDIARNLARSKLVDIQNGGDPSRERRDEREVVTVQHLFEDYLTKHAEVRKKARSVEGDKILWRLHLWPFFGEMRVERVALKDLHGFMAKMAERKGAANRSLALLSKMMSLAVAWDLRPDNPCKRVERYPENRKERFLTVDEVERLRAALSVEEDRGGAAALMLLLLTGARRSEVLKATWTQFELVGPAPLWIVPEEHLKGTMRVRTSLRRPISDEAAAILLDLRATSAVTSIEWVFPSNRTPSKCRADLNNVWDRVRSRARLTDVRIHDLRHSFASAAINSGLSLHMIGKALGHADVRTTERYAHVQDSSVRDVAESVSRAFAPR